MNYEALEMDVVLFSAEDVIDESYNYIPQDSDMADWLP